MRVPYPTTPRRRTLRAAAAALVLVGSGLGLAAPAAGGTVATQRQLPPPPIELPPSDSTIDDVETVVDDTGEVIDDLADTADATVDAIVGVIVEDAESRLGVVDDTTQTVSDGVLVNDPVDDGTELLAPVLGGSADPPTASPAEVGDAQGTTTADPLGERAAAVAGSGLAGALSAPEVPNLAPTVGTPGATTAGNALASTDATKPAAAAIAAALRSVGFPVALALTGTLFAMAQGWIDRRDPKLADAPLDALDATLGFE